jgi:hypothetical protein
MTRKIILLGAVAGAELFAARTARAGIEPGNASPSAVQAEPAAANPPSVLPYVRRAKKATAWRMGIVENPDPSRPSRRMYKFGPPEVLSAEQLSRLQGELGRLENIGAGSSFCGFEPAIAVVFQGDDFSLELQFCFFCDELSADLDGKPVKMVSIVPGRAAFLGFFKEVFPADKVIQSLPLKNAFGDGKKTK